MYNWEKPFLYWMSCVQENNIILEAPFTCMRSLSRLFGKNSSWKFGPPLTVNLRDHYSLGGDLKVPLTIVRTGYASRGALLYSNQYFEGGCLTCGPK